MNLVVDINRHNVAEDQGLSSILESREALQAIGTPCQTSIRLSLAHSLVRTSADCDLQIKRNCITGADRPSLWPESRDISSQENGLGRCQSVPKLTSNSFKIVAMLSLLWSTLTVTWHNSLG